MGRLRGFGSFVAIAVGALLLLRLLHVGVPLFVPGVRPGPFLFASLNEVEPRVGFRPVLPAYHPASLGEEPVTITGRLIPRPTLEIVWRGERFLSVTQQRGGGMPDHPPVSQSLEGMPDSRWWQVGDRSHLVVQYEDFWIAVATDLPTRDLRRIADTLTPY
jgi:hypothetical protein